MKSIRTCGFHALDCSLLGLSSFLVPASQRPEWLREWNSEYWHVRHECLPCGGFSWQAQREVTAFCLGAVTDAICLRRHFSFSAGAPPAVHGSAAQCVLWLATLLALCAVLARLLPGVQTEIESARYQVRPGLLLIQDAGSPDSSIPTITPAQFLNWRSTRQRAFDAFAYYRTVRETAFLPGDHRTPWTVANATPNLFQLLGIPIQLTNPASNNLPGILLSHRVWLRDFHADPRIAGRAVLLAHTTARVAGVIPAGPWQLPGDPDVFLFQPSAPITDAPSTPGYLIAQLSPVGQAQMFGSSVPITAHGPNDTDIELAGVSFSPPSESPGSTFEFALFLALLALPAVTSVTLSESNFSGHRPNLKRRMARWGFLAAKVTVIAAIAYFASLDLAYAGSDSRSAWPAFVQLVSAFLLCLFGLRWAVADQRQRCPVCLRRVTHPARVGIASCTFLGWNGTEMICLGGHTLLHVPSLPTSWFGAPRWLYLDHSWDFLFANNTAA